MIQIWGGGEGTHYEYKKNIKNLNAEMKEKG